jgi:hypothetical protein
VKLLEIPRKGLALPRRKLIYLWANPLRVREGGLPLRIKKVRCLLQLSLLLISRFSEIEDLLRSYPASKFAEYHRDYAAKASISGRIACEHLIEQEKINKKLLEDSQKLNRDFKLSRAANLDLEKKVAKLVVALKKC